MQNNTQSIFRLSKTNQGSELQDTTTKIHTVNFESVGSLEQEGLSNYFETRFQFLKQSYDYAKHIKVNENKMFIDDAATQTDMGLWLKQNGDKSAMITGTEFGVITTKVRESIASIAKNPYITGLKNDFLEFFIKLDNPGIEWDKKEKKKENEKFVKDQIKRLNKNKGEKNKLFINNLVGELTEQKIIEICKYELFQSVQVWIEILEKLHTSTQLEKLFAEELHNNLILFRTEYTILIGNIMLDLKEFMDKNAQNVSDILDTFVDQFYFTFDPKIRELEAIHMTAINELINSFMQNLNANIFDINSDICTEQNMPKIKNAIFNLNKLNYLKSETVGNFVDILENILAGKFEELDKQQQKSSKLFDNNNIFLAHPKSAPSYPSIGDRVISWSNQNCTSQLFNNTTNFNSKKFFDYLLFRCKAVIENTNSYQIYQFLTDTEFGWVDILNSKLSLIALDNSKIKINTKEIRSKKDNSIIKIIYNISFWYKSDDLKRSQQKQNSKFSQISIKSNESLTTSDIINRLELQLTREINQIQLSQIELKLFLDIKENLNQTWIQEWVALVKSSQTKDTSGKIIPNYAKKTDERLKKLTRPELQDTPIIIGKIKDKLQKLENHLLLSKDQNSYKVFDKMAFKQYQNFSQLVYESIASDPKQIRQQKANLAKLTLDRDVVIPIKIDRMTNRTNGNSTLAFEVSCGEKGIWQIKESLVNITNSYIVVKPIKIKNNGQEIKIVDTIDKVNKELVKEPKIKVLAGFLNGSGDTGFDTNFNQVFGENGEVVYSDVLGKNGESKLKGYTTYKNWRLTEEIDGNVITYFDEKRGNLETVGATSPAGYPKLYFFLVSENCNNLVIPVSSNFYYLTKYTPYHKLNQYLQLMSGSSELLLEQKVSKAKEVLELRCELRTFYRISSIEADLIQKLTLIKGVIIPKLYAKAHMQFGNPQIDISSQFVKMELNDKNKEIKVSKFEKGDFESRYENLLGVDLGEKLLASITIIPFNYSKNDKSKALLQTYLPVYDKDIVVDGNEHLSDFSNILARKVNYVEQNTDQSFVRFNKIVKKYESQQRQFGVVSEVLKNKKKNLTNNLIEKISTQITKLCIEFKAFPVFENLPTGFKGSNKYQLPLYTEIYRHTMNKLIKTGNAIDFDFEKYQPSTIDQGIANVRAFGTSKTCSNCGFAPFRFNADKEYTEYNLESKKGLSFEDNNWLDNGVIDVYWNEHTTDTTDICEKILSIKRLKNGADISLEITKYVVAGKPINITEDLKVKTYFYKDKTNTIPKPVYEGLINALITPKTTVSKKLIDTSKSFILRNILNPRPTQDTYDCPRCGHTCNADYQASLNIAKKFIKEIRD
jgi:Putative transposase DNA-binding domain